ncbi:hypothetical protein J4411_00755 [Candidatus Pacearchaeota archaeon]|nr:hypothetical protein [uncultured archaeon]MBS3084426.1 hypothetical protein [Candidatus Pacearchaeota archaeon]
MNKSDIPKFISAGLKRGLSIEEIKEHLLARGFFDCDISEAVNQLNLKEFTEKEKKPEPKKEETIEGWDKDLVDD